MLRTLALPTLWGSYRNFDTERYGVLFSHSADYLDHGCDRSRVHLKHVGAVVTVAEYDNVPGSLQSLRATGTPVTKPSRPARASWNSAPCKSAEKHHGYRGLFRAEHAPEFFFRIRLLPTFPWPGQVDQRREPLLEFGGGGASGRAAIVISVRSTTRGSVEMEGGIKHWDPA